MVQSEAVTASDGHKNFGWGFTLAALFVTFAIPIFTWYVLYRTAGYNLWTLRIALLVPPMVGALFLVYMRQSLTSIGLTLRHMLQAVILSALAYGLILAVGFAMNSLFDSGLTLLRSGYSHDAFFENWVLTAFGEELLFCGVLLALAAARLPGRKRWMAVVLVALLFALWHMPGYLAQGRAVGDMAGRMGLNFASWLFFGTIYALSGNLWLSAFTHASTDYGISPLVTEEPMFGLAFMVFLVAASWAVSRRNRETKGLKAIPAASAVKSEIQLDGSQ
jgi:membrane protease YdiL (CAAX protease family)